MDGLERAEGASDFRTEGGKAKHERHSVGFVEPKNTATDFRSGGHDFRSGGAGRSGGARTGSLVPGGSVFQRFSTDSPIRTEHQPTSRSRVKTFILQKPKVKILRNQIKLRDYQIEELGKAFDIFDENGEGKMNIKDIKTVIRACGFEPTKDEIKTIRKECDPHNKGYLSKEDFIKLFMLKLTQKDPREEIERAFKFFDKGSNGFITFHDLKLCAQEIGEDLHDEEIQEMMDEADMNDDGIIDLEEFIKMMTKTYYFE